MSPVSTAAWVAIWAHIAISLFYFIHFFRSLEAVTGLVLVVATLLWGIATGIVIIWSDQHDGKYKAVGMVMVGVHIVSAYHVYFTIAYIVPAALFLGAALGNCARQGNSS